MRVKLWEVVQNSNDLRIFIASSRPIKRKVGSELIMWSQGTDYSHVLIIINDTVFQASHGLANVFSMENFLKENVLVDKIEIDKNECDFSFLFETLGTRYGFFQLVRIALKVLKFSKIKIINKMIKKDNGNKFVICSEYVGKFFKLEWVNDLTDPEDIISHLYTIKKYK